MTINSIKYSVIFCLIALTASIYSGCSSSKQQVDLSEQLATVVDSIAKERAFDYYLNGSIHEEAGEFDLAAQQYQLANLFDPTSATISIALAEAYLMTGEEQAAILVLDKSRRINPADEELITTSIKLHLRMRMPFQALELYDSLEKIRPLTTKEILHRGSIMLRLDMLDEALALYRDYIKNYGDNPEINGKIARIYIVGRDIENAEIALLKVIAQDSLNHQVLFVLGGFAVARQEWLQAEAYFKRAVDLEEMNPRYWSNYMFALSAQDKVDEVLELTEQTMRIFPDSAPFLDIRAGVLEDLGRLDEAIETLDRSIALDSTRVEPLLNKGYIYHQLKEWDKSAQSYDRALVIDPENPLILNNYAYMLSVCNRDLDKALEMVNRALDKEPENPSFLDTRGWLLYRLGNYQDALEQVLEALKRESANAELYEHLGYIHEALGDPDKAKSAWKHALELNPKNESYKELVK